MSQHATDAEVLWASEDDRTASLLTEHLANRPGVPVTALFREEAVAGLWQDQPGVSARSWEPTLVRDVLTAFPPQLVERLAPPPVVIGDSAIARALVQEILAGWESLTHTLTIHCLGSDDTWARDAWLTNQRAEVTWLTVPLQASSVIRALSDLVEQWPRPKPNRGTQTGPTIYVAATPEGRALAVSGAVAEALPDARVVAVVSGDIAWPAPEKVAVFTAAEARTRVAAQAEDPTARLARLLFDDAAWLGAPGAEATAPPAPLFPGLSYGPDGRAVWQDQDALVRSRFAALAEACPHVLAAGGVEACSRGPRRSEPLVCSPTELAAMAEKVLAVLKTPRSAGTWLTAVECAAHLPVLATRAGFALRRVSGDPLLTPELVNLLAPQVHLTYQDASAATSNASGSPLAAQLWDGLTEFEKASNREVVVGCAVAYASEGLAWREATTAGGTDITGHLDRLAELEHRRWAINERRHGRGDHKWAIPWDQIEPELKSYDLLIMRAMPMILADAGLEVYEADPTGPSMT